MSNRARDELPSPSFPAGTPLGADFFARPSDQVASELVGKILWRSEVGGGRLTEVEAYLPENDPACHAYCGLTPRNAAMFGQPGTVYLYRSYGIHVLLNFVCEAEGVGSAVLVRSFAPMGETERLECNRRMAGTRRRGVDSASPPNFLGPDLSRGPGRVGQALGLSLGLNGLPLGARSGLFVIDDGWRREVACTTRVGITRGDCLLLRYCMIGSTYVTGQCKTTTGDGI